MRQKALYKMPKHFDKVVWLKSLLVECVTHSSKNINWLLSYPTWNSLTYTESGKKIMFKELLRSAVLWTITGTEKSP